jgi:uncharacterized protein involved in tolerance to divalent cations
MVVAVADFEGEVTLGQLNNPYTAAAVDVLINKYEPMFMRMCIGEPLYSELLAGLAANPIEEKWSDLKNRLLLPCTSYIYCYYMQLQSSKTTGQGLVDPELDSGRTVNPESKIIRAWNDMVSHVEEVQRFLKSSMATYPSFTFCWSELQVAKNLYGI